MTEKETKDELEGVPWYRNLRILRIIGWATGIVAIVSGIWEVVYGGDVALLASMVGVMLALSLFIYHGIEGSRREISGQLESMRRELAQESRSVGYEVRQVRDALGSATSTIVAAIRETRPPAQPQR